MLCKFSETSNKQEMSYMRFSNETQKTSGTFKIVLFYTIPILLLVNYLTIRFPILPIRQAPDKPK